MLRKQKEFADNNFKLDGNDRKFFKRVENTVGKGEIALYSASSPNLPDSCLLTDHNFANKF